MRQLFVRGIVLFGLLTALTGGMEAAEEIALVTQVTGDVQGLYLGKTWKILLGESLPVGAKITVGNDGSLSLIHLTLNQELTIPANATAEITRQRVKSSGTLERVAALEGLPASLTLEMASLHQLGAIDPQRLSGEGQPRAAEGPETESPSDSWKKRERTEGPSRAVEGTGGNSNRFDDVLENDSPSTEETRTARPEPPDPAPERQVPPPTMGQPLSSPMPAPPPPPLQNPSPARSPLGGMAGGGGSSDGSNEGVVPETGSVQDSSQETAFVLHLAVPSSLFPVEGPADLTFELQNADGILSGTLEGTALSPDWIRLSGRINRPGGQMFLVHGQSGKRVPILVHPESGAPRPSVLEAFKLEARGLLVQAAFLWLELRTSAVTPKIAALHLQRLAERLQKTQ